MADSFLEILAVVLGVESSELKFFRQRYDLNSTLIDIPAEGYKLTGGLETLLETLGLSIENLGVPEEVVEVMESFVLKELHVDPEKPSKAPIYFNLEIENDFTLLNHPEIKLKNPGIQVHYENKPDYKDSFGRIVKRYKVNIYGDFLLYEKGAPGSASYEKTEVNVGLSIPDMMIYGVLTPGSTIMIGEFLAHHGMDIKGMQALEISSLLMQVKFTAPTHIGFNIGVKSDWELFGGLSITALGLNFQKSRDDISGGVGGTISIENGAGEGKDLDISVEADYNGEGSWYFGGSTGPDQKIPIGHFIGALVNKLGHFDPPKFLEEATIENIRLGYRSIGETKTFDFHLEVTIPIKDKELKGTLSVSKTNGADAEFEITGTIMLGFLIFHFDFSKGADGMAAIADVSYKDGYELDVTKELLVPISPSLSNLPSLTVTLKDAFFVFVKEAKGVAVGQPKSSMIGGIDIDLGIGLNLTKLPLIGSIIPDDKTIKLNNIRIVLVQADLDQTQFDMVNGLLANADISELKPKENNDAGAYPPLKKGVLISADFQVPGEPNGLLLSAKGGDPPKEPGKSTPQPVPNDQSSNDIDKKAGAIHIQKLGIGFTNGKLKFTVTGGLVAGPVQLDFLGLEFSSPLDKFKPSFGLNGLALDLEKGGLKVEASFMRSTITDPDGYTYDEYAGMVSVGYEEFELVGIGAYAKYKGHPSLFLYAFLGFPIGGPPAFFVTGAALGFGVNRNLIAPTIDKVSTFPLVTLAKSKNPSASSTNNSDQLDTIMTSLHEYIPPQIGEYWVAAGIRFTSFEIIDVFALLTIKFGHEFEIDLLGVASVDIPLANVELQFSFRFVPAQGMLMVRGQLTDKSYIFMPEIELTGGFATGFWFDGIHAGDFIVSVGGYNKKFDVPDHYPKNIPRLGINWQVSSRISIKGGVYFALTPKAIMAGGGLSANVDLWFVKLWMKINANFMIYFKPFFFEVDFSVEVGGHIHLDLLFVTINFDFDLTVKCGLWGSKHLSGMASLDVGPKSFKVEFGPHQDLEPDPISWLEFKQSFLPGKNAADDEKKELDTDDKTDEDDDKKKKKAKPTVFEVLTLSVTGGQHNKSEEEKDESTERDELPIMNAKEFELTIDSVIPITHYALRNEKMAIADLKNIPVDANQALGISPMSGKSSDPHPEKVLDSKLIISLPDYEKNATQLNFDLVPIYKNVPAALWKQTRVSKDPKNKNKPVMENALTGFKIKPGQGHSSPHTHEFDRENLAVNLDEYQSVQENFHGTLFESTAQINTEIDLVKEEDKEWADATEQNEYLKMLNLTAS